MEASAPASTAHRLSIKEGGKKIPLLVLVPADSRRVLLLCLSCYLCRSFAHSSRDASRPAGCRRRSLGREQQHFQGEQECAPRRAAPRFLPHSLSVKTASRWERGGQRPPLRRGCCGPPSWERGQAAAPRQGGRGPRRRQQACVALPGPPRRPSCSSRPGIPAAHPAMPKAPIAHPTNGMRFHHRSRLGPAMPGDRVPHGPPRPRARVHRQGGVRLSPQRGVLPAQPQTLRGWRAGHPPPSPGKNTKAEEAF